MVSSLTITRPKLRHPKLPPVTKTNISLLSLVLLCTNTQCTAGTIFDFRLRRLHPSILVETISNPQVPEAVLP